VQWHVRAWFVEHQDVRGTGPDVGAPLDVVAGLRQASLGGVEVLPDLVADRDACLGRAFGHNDAVVVGAGGQEGAVRRGADQLEVEHLVVVLGHPVHVRRLEPDVAQLRHTYCRLGVRIGHGTLPVSVDFVRSSSPPAWTVTADAASSLKCAH
jgi:hypothetical protein